MTKNRGIDLEREKLEQTETDWVFGSGSLSCLASIPLWEREKYLPTGERQNIGDEKSDCATRAPINCLEVKFNYLLKNNLIKTENSKWLFDNGYIDNGEIIFSDRFIAVLSGTTQQGNSLKSPIDTIRKFGLIPKKMLPQVSTFTEYYDKEKITQKMYDLGTEFLRRFEIHYDKVYEIDFDNALKEDMIIVAGYAWPTPIGGEYPKTELPFNHAWLNWKPKTYAFDNYEESPNDFVKLLAEDYDFYEYGYRLFITRQTTAEERKVELDLFQVLVKFGLLAYFAEWWRRFTKSQEVTQKNMKTKQELLLEEAEKWLGQDASPEDIAPDEVGCAESVSNIIANVLPFYRSVKATTSLQTMLDTSKNFRRTLLPSSGCIIVSPRTKTTYGHAGIVGRRGKIISNDSSTGKMEENYTFDEWIKEFKEKRKLRILIWEVL